MAPFIGSTVSHYKILEKLGGGGMGVVYKAKDTRLKRIVALKFLPPELTRDPAAIERFIHEAQAASALDHPNVCTVFEIGEADDGQLFIAMACYDGETLKRVIEKGPLPVGRAVGIALQVAQGLGKAHDRGIVHRDIKPANVMITSDGMAKILDFGLAKLSGRSLLTKSGTTLGTAAYMSPEQAIGESLDGRTDIWSLGVMLYEMLTGHRPFESDYDQALVYSILNEDPKPMRNIRPEIPEALEKIVRRMMGKKTEDRYQNAAELEADLEAFSVGSGLAKKTQRLSGRKGRKVVLAAAGALIVIGAGLLLLLPDVDPKMSSMAILPFVNVAKDPEIEYLCDGLAEALTDQIARLPQLEKVTAFNGALYYKGKDIPPPEIGKQLGVETLLITRLHAQGDSVILTMELVNARENAHLWSGRFQEGKSRLNRVVPSVFLSLATELDLATGSSQPEVASEVSEAYRLYLKSRFFYYKGTVEGYRQSMVNCQEAVSLDSSFALAYTGLVEGYVQRIGTDFLWDQVRDSAATAAQKAVQLDNNLPQAYAALGLVDMFNLNLRRAEQDYLRALALNRSYSEGYHYYAHLLTSRGEFEKGFENMEKAIDLAPTWTLNQFCYGFVYILARRYNEAEMHFERLRQQDSTSIDGDFGLFEATLQEGKIEKATATALRLGSRPGAQPSELEWRLADIAAKAGRREEALTRVRHLEAQARKEKGVGVEQFDAVKFARIYARLGMKEEALERIEQAFVQSSGLLVFSLNVAPEFDVLRGDARFTAFLRRAGFLE